MRKVSSRYIDDLAKKLANDGESIIRKAFQQANYDKGKTQNLHDSYGSVVYYDYKIYPNSKRFLSVLSTSSKYDPYTDQYITGRRAIEEFFGTYRPSDDGMQLVIVVAMFYGEIIEQGKQGGLGRKYKVIMHVGDDVMALANKIKGTRVQLIQNGRING